MTTRTIGTSPQVYARIAGILYLLIIVVGALDQIFIRGRLIVSGDAMSTAKNIIAAESLWRIGIAGDIILHVFDIPIMLVMYILLKPVNKNLALLAVLFNLIQTAVLVVNKLNLLMPLFLLGNADYLKAIEPSQLYALSYLFVRVHDFGFGIGLIFFGFACLIYGYLLFSSGYFPRAVGVLIVIAGLSYLTNSFTLILAPKYSGAILPVLALALIGELSLSLWLIVRGVNLPKWEKRALESA
ncbi:MAG: DUF4386 domain-containing protein [Chloroflexi bacterium]|nr:DUF4386 domain-containing protein [Chloroflexota bacterium]